MTSKQLRKNIWKTRGGGSAFNLHVNARQLRTKPIKFVVGQDREFYLHRGFVSRLSAPLNDLVNSGNTESSEVCVTWKDIDDDVFSRFVQFAYTGAYKGFAPSRNDDSSEGATGTSANRVEEQRDSSSTENSLFESGAPPKRQPFTLPYSLASYRWAAISDFGRFTCKLHSTTSEKHKHKLLGRAWCECDPDIKNYPSEKKRDFVSAIISKQGSLENFIIWRADPSPQKQVFQDIFLGHAKMWVLAHAYAISALMDQAHSHLAHELVHWTISPATFVHEFGGLVRYVYDRAVRGCQLRLLVAHFAACIVEDVADLEGWPELLREMPDFAADLVEQMRNRL